MIRPITSVLLLALVAAIGGTSWWTVRALKRPRSVLELKLAEAQRVLYYRMSHHRAPMFRLSGSEKALRLITHAMLPPGLPYDPGQRIRYGVKLVITSEGREVWKHELYTQSRQSKDELDDGVWRRENSFIRDHSIQVTDDRIFLVHLPADIPPHAVLHTYLLGDDSLEGLIRVYEQEARGRLEREVAARTLAADRQRAEVWSNTYDPWAMLPENERLSRVRYRTERLSAIGEHGTDYDTQVLYYTGFRLPLSTLEVEEAIKIHRHRHAALNVVGPTEISVRAEHLGDASEPLPGMMSEANVHAIGDATIEVSAVSAMAGASVQAGELGAGETTSVFIPAGLHSLRFVTDSEATLGLWVTGQKQALFGAPADVGDEVGRLRPDDIRIPVLLSGPDDALAAVEVAGLGAPDPLDRVLRVEVRFVDTGAADDVDRFAGELSATFLDADRRVVRATRKAVRSERAPFEWLDRTGMPAIELSEPMDVRLIMPLGIASVTLRTSRPAVLRLFRYLPGEQLYELPYREAELDDDVHWRYARIEKRIWWPMRAINHELLGDNEQLATLVAQARLERRGNHVSSRIDERDELYRRDRDQPPALEDTSDAARVPTVVIEPLGDPERHMIIEPLAPEQIERARAEWGAGMVAELPRGGAAYRWPGATGDTASSEPWSRRRARIQYWLDSGDLGKTVTLRIGNGNDSGDGSGDGHARQEKLWTTHGAWELPPLAAGAHRLEVAGDAGSLRLFVDRPPLSPEARLYRLRTVFAMDRVPLRVPVVKRAGKRTVLYAVVYAPGIEARDDIQVRSVISGGRPQRVEGELVPYLSRAEHLSALPAARHDQPAMFTDHNSGSAGHARVLAIPLGEDLVAGTHFVEIYSVTGRKLWVRFYVTDHAPTTADERALQWNFHDMQ